MAPGERLNVSPEAIRARAIRGHWRRQLGNDGMARVMVSTEILHTPDQRPVNGRSTPVRKAGDQATLIALREHVATLKADNERLVGDNDRLHADLVTERERADRAIAEFVELARRLTAQTAETEPEPPPHWAIRLALDAKGLIATGRYNRAHDANFVAFATRAAPWTQDVKR
jgi:hypothetical protein